MLWVGAALLFSMGFFMPGLLEQFEAPKVEAVRVCGLGALALSAVAGLAGRPRRWRALDRAVVAWLAVEVVTTALSVSPRVSLLGEPRQREGLLTSAALAGLYFVARDAFARRGRVRGALDLMLAAAALVGLYALVQIAGADPILWQRVAVYPGGYVRPFATLGNANLLGVLAAATASLGVALAVAGEHGARGWLRAMAAGLLAAVACLTLSRAAWLALGLGLATAIGLAVRERGTARRTPRALGLAGAAPAVAGVVITMAAVWNLVALRSAETVSGEGSGASRIEYWRAALAAWRQRPLVGQGPDAFEMVFPRFQTPEYWRVEWTGLPFHAHSIYLHTLATRGLAGLLVAIAWAVALAAAAVTAWRGRAQAPDPALVPAGIGALAALAVAGAFGALGITGALMLVLISALLATAAEAAEPGTGAVSEPAAGHAPPARHRADAGGRRGAAGARRGEAPPLGPRRRATRIAATAVALVALVWGFTELRASRAASAAQAFMTRDPPRAVQAARYAVSLAPGDDRLWRMDAEALLWLTTVTPEHAALLGEAAAAARRAVALAPARAENHLILARALGAREAEGDTTVRGAVTAAFARSVALAPMDGLSLIEFADHESMAGRPETALPVARRAVALYPARGEVLAALARAQASAGEADSARATLRRALRATWSQPSERAQAERELEGLAAPPSAKP